MLIPRDPKEIANRHTLIRSPEERRYRYYRMYLIAQLISGFGSLMAAISVIYVTLQITHETTKWVAVAEAAEYVPILVLAPPVGKIVERYLRRNILLVTQVVQVTATIGLGLLFCLGYVKLWPIVAYATVLGVVQPANIAARQVFFSDLLGTDGFQKGIASYNALFGIGRMAAPVICGFMIQYLGAGWVFIVNGISFSGVIVVLIMINPTILSAGQPSRAGRRDGKARDKDHQSFRKLLESILPTIIVVILVGSLGYQFVTTNALMVHGVFHSGASDYGLLGGTLAIGMILGSWWARKRQTRSIIIVCGAAVTLGITETAALAITSIYEYMPLLFIAGSSVAIFTVSAMDFLQRSVDRESRGTAMTIYNAAYIGFVPIGTLFIGWCSRTYGTRMSVAFPGLIVASGSLVIIMLQARRRGQELNSAITELTSSATSD